MQAEIVNQSIAQDASLSKRIRNVSPWMVLRATVIKDLRISLRYLPNLVGGIIALAIRLLFFLFFSYIVTFQGQDILGRQFTGQDMFIFFQGAVLLFIFKNTALWTPLEAVQNDLYNGTLEFLYSNPASRYAYYMGTIVANIALSQIIFLPLYFILVFTTSASLLNMLMVLVVCIAVLLVLVAMGIMIGLLGLLWRQVTSIAGIIEISLEMLTGAYFPLASLPVYVLIVSYVLPFTWGYDLIRYYSFNGSWRTILPVWQEWSILIGFGVVFTILSRYLLVKVERYAKKNGLHLI